MSEENFGSTSSAAAAIESGDDSVAAAAGVDDQNDSVLTLMDVIKEQDDLEEHCAAVLGASEGTACTYSKGYVKRQAIYACLTCNPNARTNDKEWAGLCLPCSYSCHEGHNLIELYTRRNFRCDCGTKRMGNVRCALDPLKFGENDKNIYNQNYGGVYCICKRPYPDPEDSISDEMIQCAVCEDWYHSRHLGQTDKTGKVLVPKDNRYTEMICGMCMEKNEFLESYCGLCVTTVVQSENEANISSSSSILSSTITGKNDVSINVSDKTDDDDVDCSMNIEDESASVNADKKSIDNSNCEQNKDKVNDGIDGINAELTVPLETTNTTVENELPTGAATTTTTTAAKTVANVPVEEENSLTHEINQCLIDIIEINHDGVPNKLPSTTTAADSEINPEKRDDENKNDDAEPQKKRMKLNGDDNDMDEIKNIDITNNSGGVLDCKRPKVKVPYEKGTATFWTLKWRTKLCVCVKCMRMYEEGNIKFLLDLDDTVLEYEKKGLAKKRETNYDHDMRALSTLNHSAKIDVITGYNRLKDKLKEFLVPFVANQITVTEDDINRFFKMMKDKK